MPQQPRLLKDSSAAEADHTATVATKAAGNATKTVEIAEGATRGETTEPSAATAAGKLVPGVQEMPKKGASWPRRKTSPTQLHRRGKYRHNALQDPKDGCGHHRPPARRRFPRHSYENCGERSQPADPQDHNADDEEDASRWYITGSRPSCSQKRSAWSPGTMSGSRCLRCRHPPFSLTFQNERRWRTLGAVWRERESLVSRNCRLLSESTRPVTEYAWPG